jgi:hypothetical protein
MIDKDRQRFYECSPRRAFEVVDPQTVSIRASRIKKFKIYNKIS